TRPDVHVVVTARTLEAPGTASFAIQPLSFPPEPARHTATEALAFSAVRLFVQEAARHLPGFVLSRENTEPAVGICRLAGGFPLAIKLAAAWLPHMPMNLLPEALGSDLLQRLAGRATGAHPPETRLASGAPTERSLPA
ncbi:MAG TPA: hypothetical protein VEB23_04265, partial [Ramlibacter sp.]|nr:hypothetical protein [Ramlibacter sp.]